MFKPNSYKFEYMDFLMGALVFSPISSLITIEILHLPFSMPELILLPFLPHFRKNWWPKIFKTKYYFGLLLVWVALFSISIIKGEYPIKEIIGCGRTYFYIFFFSALFRSFYKFDYHRIFIVAIGTLTGWMGDALYKFVSLLSMGPSLSYGPMIAIPIMIGYPLLRGQLKKGGWIFFICVVIGTIGMLRRVIFIAGLNFGLYWLWIAYRNKKRKVTLVRLIVIVSIIACMSYPTIRSFIKEYDHDMYVRVIEKSESIFNESSNVGDEGRNDMRNEFFSTLESYVIPQGFVSKNYLNGGDGSFNDFPLKEITYTFGLVAVIALLVYYTIEIEWIRIKIKKNIINQRNFMLISGYITMLFLLFLEGSFITFPYQSFYTGFFLGAIPNRAFHILGA